MSRTRHDRLDKESLLHWLERLGTVRLNHPIAGEVLLADVVFEQTHLRPAYRRKLGLLGRLLHRRQLFEGFRNPATDRELVVARAKLVLFNEGLFRLARRRHQPASTVELASLCVLTPHLPLAQRRRFGLAAATAMPRGVWSLPPAERTVVVALDELPAEPGTVWLRMMGRGAVQQGAIEELEARFGQDELIDATLGLLLAWRQSSPEARARADEEDAMTPHLQQVYDRLQNKLKAEGKVEGKVEGKAEGKAEGLRIAVTDLCEVLGIAVGKTRQAHLQRLGLEELLALRQHLKQHRAWPR